MAAEVKDRNQGRVMVHNVALGDDADYDFMQTVSAQNGGFFRYIFDNMDAAVSVGFPAVKLANLRNCELCSSWVQRF